MQIFFTLILILGFTAAAFGQTAEKSDQAAKTEQPAKAKSDASADAAKNKNKKGKPKAPPSKAAPAKVEPPPQTVVHDMSVMKKVMRAIEESVDLSPTLVVWLFDRTASARGIVNEVAKDAEAFYRSRHVVAWSSLDDQPLLTSIVAFDDKLEFLVDPPSPDSNQFEVAFDKFSSSSSSREMTFTAIKRTLEKYLPMRTRDERELVLIVVTDEAGDDSQLVDELIAPLRKYAISIYCVGLPAPWGQSNPFAPNPKAVPAGKDDLMPTVGPESIMSERVDIEDSAERVGGRNLDIVDSGFGPFALERLCHETRGHFFALRPELGANPRGANARSWPPGNELRFDEKVIARYAPDYVSAKEYEKLLGENKAKAAVVAAARLPKLKVEGQSVKRFEKDQEAKMAQKMTAAQQFAARSQPPTDHLYDLLLKAEPDRVKLTSPRWQAEFDLALGRTAASKARLDGYNSMIAALKRGKTFQKSDSKAWMLDPADSYETESAIKKVADKAKQYLERVKQDHAGTPWATIAEEELKTPLGWTWRESP
jgi:hypothetical protein